MTWAKYQWDRVAAGVLVVVGLVALLLGYLGISGTVYPAEQLPYIISGGILGIFCLGSAGVLYLSADMRDEWRKLDELDQTIKNAGLLFAASLDEASPAAPAQQPLRSVPLLDPPTAPIQAVPAAPIQAVPAEAPDTGTPAPARAPRAARTRQPAANPRPARSKKPLQSEALPSS